MPNPVPALDRVEHEPEPAYLLDPWQFTNQEVAAPFPLQRGQQLGHVDDLGAVAQPIENLHRPGPEPRTLSLVLAHHPVTLHLSRLDVHRASNSRFNLARTGRIAAS